MGQRDLLESVAMLMGSNMPCALAQLEGVKLKHINMKASGSRTITELAAIYGNVPMLQALREKGVDLAAPCVILFAAHHLHVLEYLHDIGSLRPNTVGDIRGGTPLLNACEANIYLVNQGIKGVFENNMRCIAFLVKHGADMNAVDDKGMTSLMIASRRGLVPIYNLLIELGADTSLRCNKGKTAHEWGEDRRQFNLRHPKTMLSH